MTYPSVRGRIQPPNLDDRSWQDIVDELRALIPRYAPQWTDQNPSDLGITLLELFAWLTEGLIYRLNRVPDKNYLALLNVIGVTRNPSTPAMTYLTFQSVAPAVAAGDAPINPPVVPAGSQFESPASETRRAIVFETDDDTPVWPLDLTNVIVLTRSAGTTVTEDHTVDLLGARGDLALALDPTVQTRLCLGFTPQPGWSPTALARLEPPAQLGIELYRPAPDANVLTLQWSYPNSATSTDPFSWNDTVGDPPHPFATDTTDGLQTSGTARFSALPDWTPLHAGAPAKPTDDVPTWTNAPGAPPTGPLLWIGLQITATEATTLGISRLLFNSAVAHNALTIKVAENLGTSTGAAFQVFPLANAPLYTPFGTDTTPPDLLITVQGAGGPGEGVAQTAWRLTDDLPQGKGTFYRCNPVTAEIIFGDHDDLSSGTDGHGSIPPAGATIWASRYRYVAGGANGNVAPGTITTASAPILDGTGAEVRVTVTNPGPGIGGSDEEAVEDTLRRAPDVLRTHDRAVTKADYETLAQRVTTGLTIVSCLTPQYFDATVEDQNGDVAVAAGKPCNFAGIDRSAGNVNVIIVPDQGASEPRPAPTRALITTVQQYLVGRSDLTAAVTVWAPVYLPVKVHAVIKFWNGVDADMQNAVIDDTKRRIAAVLHPTRGRADGHGWKVGQSVLVSDLFGPIAPPEDIGYIAELGLMVDMPPYLASVEGPLTGEHRPIELPDPTTVAPVVEVCDYELVCAAAEPDVSIAT